MSFQNIPSLQSASAGACRDTGQTGPIVQNHVDKEKQCVLHWFQCWSGYQKDDFLKFLLDRAVPQNVDSLFHAMNNMNVQDKPMSIFQCQLKLLGEWFSEWTDGERNDFMFHLGTLDPIFVARFKEEAAKASQM